VLIFVSPVCDAPYDADLCTVFLHPCPVICVLIHHDVRPIHRYLVAILRAHIGDNRLNSRVHVRSRLRGDRHTVVKITHEQVIDGHQHSSLKLESHSSSEMLAMMRVNEAPTLEKAVEAGENIC
jgi:hypothetical protein